uniref:Antitoxin n=1 Tax=Candidatus Kentrum sp. MB TaxID=2138164 RepID=A0A451BF02_9GAMM|nr:MAG: prevent-host-death family protein [Candidatus Kentron sp. MB]VFK34606.1 MAG: prevent-host-death family protein [Candidatus Kentron sp. MB]VFK76857.1 MAG: prevent-host-death family protein [Candidatus Kentron sp. MB]
MTICNATEAGARLYGLIEEAVDTHRPIIITGEKGNAVLVSEDDLEFHLGNAASSVRTRNEGVDQRRVGNTCR